MRTKPVAIIAVAALVTIAAGALADTFVLRRGDVQPMAISTALMRMDMTDADQAGAIDIDFHYRLSTNNAEAIAMGAQHRGVVVKMECEPRATCLNAIATLINNSLVVQDGGWPEGAIALPRPRKP